MSERSIKVRGLFALYPPIRPDSDEHVSLYNAFVTESRNPRKLRVRGSGFHDGEELLVRTAPCSSALEKRIFAGRQFALRARDVIEFSGSFKFPGASRYFFSDHTGKVIPESEANLRASWRSFLPDDLDLIAQTYVCSAIIAYPGAIRPVGNIWFVGDKQHQFSRYHVSIIHDAIEYLRKNEVNPEALSLWNVYKWISSQSGVFDGYSNNAGARALNYFTRLFVPNFREDELSNTVWAVAGIEALLVERPFFSWTAKREDEGRFRCLEPRSLVTGDDRAPVQLSIKNGARQ